MNQFVDMRLIKVCFAFVRNSDYFRKALELVSVIHLYRFKLIDEY